MTLSNERLIWLNSMTDHTHHNTLLLMIETAKQMDRTARAMRLAWPTEHVAFHAAELSGAASMLHSWELQTNLEHLLLFLIIMKL